jgi:hypothetical protein
MVFKPVSSGNPAADLYIARRRVNDAFMRDLLKHWQENGPQVIDRVAKEQPGTLLKCMTMLVPKEMKIEHTNPTGRLSDEELAMMIAALEERLTGETAKVINAEPVDAGKRQPKSTPERLAYAREYKRQRKVGNPDAAAAARSAAQAAKAADEPTPPA